MAKSLNSNTIISCGNCREKVDLNKAVSKSEDRRDNNIRCPKCNHILGELKR